MDQATAADLEKKYNELVDDLVPALRQYVTAAIRSGAIEVKDREPIWLARAVLTAALEDYGDQYEPRPSSSARRGFQRTVTNIIACTPRP